MKSWTTTVYGIIAALGAILIQIDDPAWLHQLGTLILVTGVGGTGMSARDNNKSSEKMRAIG